MQKEECRGKGKFCSRYTKLILFWMKIANNYSKHKVQNKNMAAFKNLVLKIAYTLLEYKSSKFIKFNIKSSEQRLFTKMTWKHFTKDRQFLICLCPVIIQPIAKSLQLACSGKRPVAFTWHPITWAPPHLWVLDQNFWSQYHQHHQAFYLVLYNHHILL